MEELEQSKFKKWMVWLNLPLLVVVMGGIFLILNPKFSNSQIFSPQGEVKKELPYEKYSFENLAKRGGIASKIEIFGDKFYYQSEGRRISGAIYFPTVMSLIEVADPEKYNYHRYPVVVMARGYVEKEGYKTGTGTKNAAKYFADHGYIALAPDFSGYGESDPEDPNALGARLSKPVEILDLLVSLESIPEANLSQVYLWGHSNGGQITLSVAEILSYQSLRGETLKVSGGQQLQIKGVTLWAPVSKPFPYNILYYTDDATDSGKWLRGQVSQFEKDYDVFDYSIDRYFDWINVPVQIHQGSADEAVPKIWSDNLAKTLKEKGKEIDYFVYPGADHNMKPNWNEVVTRDVEWFEKLK